MTITLVSSPKFQNNILSGGEWDLFYDAQRKAKISETKFQKFSTKNKWEKFFLCNFVELTFKKHHIFDLALLFIIYGYITLGIRETVEWIYIYNCASFFWLFFLFCGGLSLCCILFCCIYFMFVLLYLLVESCGFRDIMYMQKKQSTEW